MYFACTNEFYDGRREKNLPPRSPEAQVVTDACIYVFCTRIQSSNMIPNCNSNQQQTKTVLGNRCMNDVTAPAEHQNFFFSLKKNNRGDDAQEVATI